MDIYLINSKNQNELNFIKDFSKILSKDKSVLILSFERNKDCNIEDLFDMGGMITYDICDYFLDLVGLEKIIRKTCDNIDIAIAPLINSKYKIKKEDISSLLGKINYYDVLIVNGLDKDLIDDKKVIKIIDESKINENFVSDYFFIESNDKYFDIREYRHEILAKPSKFLGLKSKDTSYENIISNLLNEKNENIEKIGFFEKLKKKLAK